MNPLLFTPEVDASHARADAWRERVQAAAGPIDWDDVDDLLGDVTICPSCGELVPLPEAQLRAAWELARTSPFEGWAALFTEASDFASWSASTINKVSPALSTDPKYPRLYQRGEGLIIQEADLTVWAVKPDGTKEVQF